jgi:nitrite reductase/ring-hydroxylating ferredoxin subunit
MASLSTVSTIAPAPAAIPSGWFALGFSDELKPGQVTRARLGAGEVVLYRTADGTAHVVDPYCPHLGAHLGYGGTVEGNDIRCPFHGFKFDGTGQCVATGYGTKAPPKARLRHYPVIESHGAILAYYDNSGAPVDQAVAPASAPWTPPSYDEYTRAPWRPLMRHTFELRGHPQETSENSVDLGHFSVVHGYTDVTVDRPIATNGPHLTTAYSFTRPRPAFGTSKPIRVHIDVNVHGLGLSVVDAQVPSLGIHTRNLVLSTPIAPDRIQLRIALTAREVESAAKVHPLAALVGRSITTWFAQREAFKGFHDDVMQDFEIWQHKKYVDPAILAVGDGPIAPYRRWCAQFYPPSSAGRPSPLSLVPQVAADSPTPNASAA